MQDIFKVKDKDTFVKKIAEYTNGILTTGGFFNKTELETPSYMIFGITYGSAAVAELPVDYFIKTWVDDRNQCHKIKALDFTSVGDKPAYIMDDDYRSWEVIG